MYSGTICSWCWLQLGSLHVENIRFLVLECTCLLAIASASLGADAGLYISLSDSGSLLDQHFETSRLVPK